MNIQSLQKYIYDILGSEPSGHDYLHALRVYQNCINLMEPNVDEDVVYASAFVHDLIDHKLQHPFTQSIEDISTVLQSVGLSHAKIKHVFDIIENISYSSGKTPESIEGKIVQDADRLDALGAIGIARAFSFGGSKGRTIYDLKTTDGTDTVSHFYQKLLLLEDTFHTPKARAIAHERTEYMKTYLIQLFQEVNEHV